MRNALSWLEENPAVREKVVADSQQSGQALPDLVAGDPSVIVGLAKAIVVEAVLQDAPAGVVEELIAPVRQMAANARNLDRYQYAIGVLSSLQGLRDRSELEPVLADALGDAPDDANRAKIQDMLELVSGSDATIAEARVLPDGTTELSPHCVPCCFIGCTVCLEACILCCAAGCLLC